MSGSAGARRRSRNCFSLLADAESFLAFAICRLAYVTTLLPLPESVPLSMRD